MADDEKESLTPEEIGGREYDWLGVDRDGHVAVFVTFGGGLVPANVLRRGESHWKASRAVHKLPRRAECRLPRRVRRDEKDEFQELACRGFFVFESDPQGAPYEWIAAPENPLTLVDLPGEIEALLADVRFHGVCWATALVVPDEVVRSID